MTIFVNTVSSNQTFDNFHFFIFTVDHYKFFLFCLKKQLIKYKQVNIHSSEYKLYL